LDQPQKYDKPWKTYVQQLIDLEAKGLSGASLYEDQIKRIGYYRLSGYWYPFREPGPNNKRLDKFQTGAKFEDVLALYEFDSMLRSTVFSAVSRLEIALRVEVGHVLGKRATFGHLDPEHLDPAKVGKELGAFLSRYHAVQSKSREDFVEHFQQKYLGVLPVWVATEILQLGQLGELYGLCKFDDRKFIAETFGPLRADEFASWMNSINYVRNICAHHGRLWNRAIVNSPKIPDEIRYPELQSIQGLATRTYGVLAIITCLLKVCGFERERPQLHDVLKSFPQNQFVNLQMLGAPRNWERHAFWS